MIPRVNFNWDEFNELSVLFAKESGYGVESLRYGLHYLVWPLKYFPYPEDILLTIARYWSYCIGLLGIYYVIFKIASYVETPLFGFIAVFLTATFSTFLESSIQYRTDTFTTFFFLVGFYQVLRAGTGPPPWLMPGALLGLAMFINPKSVYHFIVILVSYGYSWCFAKDKKRCLFNMAGFAAVALTSLAIFVLFHNLFYSIPPKAVPVHVAGSARVGFGQIHTWIPKLALVWASLIHNFFQMVCILTGLLLALRHFVSNVRVPKPINLLTIAALLEALTVLIHQGVYKYYIITILPLLAILGAIPVYRLVLTTLDHQEKGSKSPDKKASQFFLILILAGTLLGIVARLNINLRDTTLNQRLHIKYLHQMFPDPVLYADGFGLLSKYNNVLGFFSGKRFIQYRRSGKARLESLFSRKFPVLIVQSGRFVIASLLPDDQKFIRDNYIPYFGNKFWIHGFRIEADALKNGVIIRLRAKGPYALKGAYQGLLVDGQPAETPIYLEPGSHRFQCRQGCGDLILTYGEKPLDEVIPNFTLQSNSAGVIHVETPGHYYLVNDLSEMTVNFVMIDSSPVIHSRKLETQPSIYLDAGIHTYKNPLDSVATIHLIGPLFIRDVQQH
jgi:hypothetical protein